LKKKDEEIINNNNNNNSDDDTDDDVVVEEVVASLIAGFAGLAGGLSGADTLGGADEEGRTCFFGRCTSSLLPAGDAFFGFCGFSVLEGAATGRAVFTGAFDAGAFDCSALSEVGLFFCRFD